jgi:hypothetical protein
MFLFGVEWECAFGMEGPGVRPIPFGEAYSELKRALCDISAWLLDGFDGIFTPGFRLYLDEGKHPEVCSVENADPLAFLELKEAIFTLLAIAIDRVREKVPGIILLANNHDYLCPSSFWGCHESYALPADPARFALGMLPFLATRHLLAGNGRIDRRGRFLLSSRAPALRCCTGGGTARDRALYSTCRQEPLMRAGPFRHRLHLLCGDSLVSQTGEFLKIATTLLVLAWLARNPCGADDLQVSSPLRLLKSSNVMWAPPGKLHVSRKALDVQFAYLRRIERFVEGDAALPSWCSMAVALWGATLRALRDDPFSLTTRLDPWIKLAFFDAVLDRLGRKWSDIASDPELFDRLALLDVGYHRIERDGSFRRMDREGKLEHRLVPERNGKRIEEIVGRIPTRAAARAQAIIALRGSREHICGWSEILCGLPPRHLDLGDPTSSRLPLWTIAPDTAAVADALMRWRMLRDLG